MFCFILQVFPLISCRFSIHWHLLGILYYWQGNKVCLNVHLSFILFMSAMLGSLKTQLMKKVTYLHSNLQLSSGCTPVMSMSLTKSKSLIFSNYLKKFLRSFPMAKIVLIFSKKKPIMFKWLQKTSDKHRYQCVNCTGEGHWKLY